MRFYTKVSPVFAIGLVAIFALYLIYTGSSITDVFDYFINYFFR